MNAQTRMQEIQKLRSAFAAGSHDFRNVHCRLAELLVEAGERLEAASVAFAAVDTLWIQEHDVIRACNFLEFARRCCPDDFGVSVAYRRRICAIRADVRRHHPRIRAPRATPRSRHLSIVPSS